MHSIRPALSAPPPGRYLVETLSGSSFLAIRTQIGRGSWAEADVWQHVVCDRLVDPVSADREALGELRRCQQRRRGGGFAVG